MIKVAITGNIGAGKTTISKLFKELGVPVFNSDLCARNAENDVIIKQGFKDILGDDIYVNDQLDRVKMRSIVFVDKDKLKLVNELVIPYVKKSFEEFILEHSDANYVMLESAILFETGADIDFDYIVSVAADTDIRIKRVLNRDKVTLEEVQNKLNNQWPLADVMAKSDFVIENNGFDILDELDVLTQRVYIVHQSILGHELVKQLRK